MKKMLFVVLSALLALLVVIPSFSVALAVDDSVEVLGTDDENGVFIPADEVDGVGEYGVMPLAVSPPSGVTLRDAFSLPVSSDIISDPSFYSTWSGRVDRSSALTFGFVNPSANNSYGTASLYIVRDSRTTVGRLLWFVLTLQYNGNSVFSTSWVSSFKCDSSHVDFYNSFTSFSYSSATVNLSFPDSIFVQQLPFASLPNSLQSPSAIADSIASSPSAVQSLATALSDAGLGGSDPSEVWTSSLPSHSVLTQNAEYGFGLTQSSASAIDTLVTSLKNSVGAGLAGTTVNVYGIVPPSGQGASTSHDGPVIPVGNVSTTPLQALLDAIIYSPLVTAKRWVWNGSLEPPTLSSTSNIAESQAMAENFHSLGVFMNNENSAIKSLISSEVGYGNFDTHEITSDGVVLGSSSATTIVGALATMSNDITGMLSNLGFVLADPDDVKLKQDVKDDTESARDTLFGDDGVNKSDAYQQSNDLKSMMSGLPTQGKISDFNTIVDNQNIWSFFLQSTWENAVQVPAVASDLYDYGDLYLPEDMYAYQWNMGGSD